MPKKIDRRRFVGGSAVLLGTALVGLACGSEDKKPTGSLARPAVPTRAYRLDACGGDCKACLACQRHGENKYFSAEASIVRAHEGCNCGVTSREMPSDTYANLFLPADAPPRTSVDARWPWVSSLL